MKIILKKSVWSFRAVAAWFLAGAVSLGAGGIAAASEVDEPFATEFKVRGGAGNWFVSDGWRSGDWQACDWARNRIELGGGAVRVNAGLAPDGETVTCGEVQTKRRFGYGLFEASIRAPNVPGMLSSFFLYIEPKDDLPSGQIGTQFPGQDKAVHFVHSGADPTEQIATFDLAGSNTARTFSMLWTPERIVWFVDGQIVYSKAGEMLPDRPMKAFFTVWASEKFADWLGPLRPVESVATLEVENFSFTPEVLVCEARPEICAAVESGIVDAPGAELGDAPEAEIDEPSPDESAAVAD